MNSHTSSRLSGKSGAMPSLFASSASLRSRSLSVSENTNQQNSPNPYIRRGSATIEALTRGLRKKSGVEVVLEGKDEFVRTYSTFDTVQGHVVLNFDKDTVIDDMTISFEGQSQTYVEKMATASPTTGRTTGKHTFLRMAQPIASDSLPENLLVKANETYKVPFTFVVPDRLLPYICSHKIEHDGVKRAHLQLPPSIGDPMLSGEGNTLMDDLAPEMAKISYAVKTRIFKASPSTGRVTEVEEKFARFRVIPAQEEQPPLSISPDNKSYILRREKDVRKGVFKIGKKLGRLTAEAVQPKSLRQDAPSLEIRQPATTMASVTLRFDPASANEQPPQMANLSSKLRIYTFYGAAAYRFLPEVSKFDSWSAAHGMYPESVNLSSRNIGSVSWTKHEPDERSTSVVSAGSRLSRRNSSTSTGSSDSTTSTGSIPAASSAFDPTLPYYTAKILVPVSLPQTNEPQDEVALPTAPTPRRASLSRTSKKIITFTPTFHSCLVSRIYALELNLSFKPVDSQGNTTNSLGTSSFMLRTPIQISQEGSTAAPPQVTDDHHAIFDMSLVEGTDEYDEAMARHLDHELNFSNPFDSTQRPSGYAHGRSLPEAIPEYEEIQTNTATPHPGAARHASIAGLPSTAAEQPPEYYSPFRSTAAGEVAAATSGPGRRHTIVTRFPTRTPASWYASYGANMV